MIMVKDGLKIVSDQMGFSVFVSQTDLPDGCYVGTKRADINEEKAILAFFQKKIKQFEGVDITLGEFIVKISKSPKIAWKSLAGLPKTTKQLYSGNAKANLMACFVDSDAEYRFVGFGVNILPELMEEIKGINIQPMLMYNALNQSQATKAAILNNKLMLISNEDQSEMVFIMKIDYEAYHKNNV